MRSQHVIIDKSRPPATLCGKGRRIHYDAVAGGRVRGGTMNHCRRRCVAALVIAFFICGPAIAAEQFVNVLTGGTSGVYYPLGVALANVIGKELPNVKTSAQATKASVENLNLLQVGRGEVAFTLGDSLSDAWKGNEEAGFKSPLKKLRGIAAIYPNYIQIVA